MKNCTKTSSKKIKRFFFQFIPSILFVVSFIAIFCHSEHVDDSGLVKFSLKYSLPPLLIYLLWVIGLLRNKIIDIKEFIIVIFISVIIFPASGFVVIRICNETLDRTSSVSYQVRVIEKIYTGYFLPKAPTQKVYMAVIPSWHQKEKQIRLIVHSEEFEKIIPGKTEIVIFSKKGYFGFEWIKSYKILEEKNN